MGAYIYKYICPYGHLNNGHHYNLDTMQTKQPNIGEILRNDIINKRNMSIAYVARQIGCSKGNVYNIFRRSRIDTELLWRFCKLLHTNYFDIMASSFDRWEQEQRQTQRYIKVP